MKIPRKNDTSNMMNPFHVDYVQGSSYAINQPIIHSVWMELLELIKKIEAIKKIKIDFLTVLKPILTQSRYPLARTKENDAFLPPSILQEALSNSQTDGEGLYSFLQKCLENKEKINLVAQVKLALCRDIYAYLEENKQLPPPWFQPFIEHSSMIEKQALTRIRDTGRSKAIKIYFIISGLLGFFGLAALIFTLTASLSSNPSIKPSFDSVIIAAAITSAALPGVCGFIFSEQFISCCNKGKRLNELPSPSEESTTNIEDLAEHFMKILNTNPSTCSNNERARFFGRNKNQNKTRSPNYGSVSITIEEEPSTSSTSSFNI